MGTDDRNPPGGLKWCLALVVLLGLTIISVITACAITWLLPSQFRLEYSGYGMSLGAVGGGALFVFLLLFYFRIFKGIMTLMEVLLVFLALAASAVFVVPQFITAALDDKISVLQQDIQAIRGQLLVYKKDHAGAFPNADFVAQMTLYTNARGETSFTRHSSFELGPYLASIPPNPFSGSSDVRIATADSEFRPGPDDGGWWYNVVTGEFRADLTDGHTTEEGLRLNQM